MMKKIIILAACNMFFCLSFGQTWPWADWSGGNGEVDAYRMIADKAGNIFVTGFYYSSVVYLGADTFPNRGIENMFIAKYDSNGNLIWANHAGGSWYDEAGGITIDKKDNIYITGTSTSPYMIFGNDTIYNLQASAGMTFTVKYDSSGHLLWAKSVKPVGGRNSGASIAVDVYGGVYITGSFTDSCFYFAGDTLRCIYTESAIYIAKYDSAGHELWAKGAGDGSFDEAGGITYDTLGYLYITGQYYYPYIVFGKDTLYNPIANNNGYTYIAKYNSNGNEIWAERATGKSNNGLNIDIDDNHNIYVQGNYSGSSISFGIDSLSCSSGNIINVFIAKFDSSGKYIWGNQSTNGGNVVGNSLSIDGNGHEYITGWFAQAAIFGSYMLSTSSFTSNLYLAGFDSYGNVIVADTATGYIGIPNADGYGITANSSGDIYLCGGFQASNLIFGQDTLTDEVVSYSNAFIAKYEGIYTGIPSYNPIFKKIIVYPNPSNGQFTIQVKNEGTQANKNIEIYNVMGQEVFSQFNIQNTTFNINLTNQPNGVYLYRVLDETGNLVGEGKIVLDK